MVKQWVLSKIASPFEIIEISLDLRFRKQSAYEKIDLNNADHLSKALEYLTIFIATYILVLEIYMYFSSGSTLSLPSIIIQVANEILVLYICIPFVLSMYIISLIKKEKIDIKKIITCSIYVMMCDIYWRFMLSTVDIYILKNIIESDYSLLIRSLNFIITIDSLFLFKKLLVYKMIVNSDFFGYKFIPLIFLLLAITGIPFVYLGIIS